MAGDFYRVECADCGNEQTLFSRAATTINCAVCGSTLARPTGGKVDVEGEVVEVIQRRSSESDESVEA